MNYLIWKGKDSREINGLIISELPPITKPQMRVAETVIDGVDGSIIEELGYSSYDKALTIGLTRNADINEVIAYFTGNGEVVFSNEEYKCYKATIVGQIDYARLVRFRVATVVFRVQPFKYEYLEKQSTLWLNEYGGRNLFNPMKPTSSNEVTYIYANSILTLTSLGTSGRYATIYNLEADEGDLILVSSILLDENCHIILQEYTPEFIQVQSVYIAYTDGATPTTRALAKKDSNNRVRAVFYTDYDVPTGERIARYKDTIITINNVNVKFEEYETTNIINSFEVENVGNYISKPVMEIKGSGEIELAVNENTLFRYTFPDNENTVIIDSQKQDAYLGAVLKNRNMSGEFPTFAIGENIITWNGTITKLSISSKSRWL